MAVSVGAMQLTLSIAIMQVPASVAVMQFLRFYCNYMWVVLSATFFLVNLFVAIMKVTVSVEIIQLSRCTIHTGESVCRKYVGDNFY